MGVGARKSSGTQQGDRHFRCWLARRQIHRKLPRTTVARFVCPIQGRGNWNDPRSVRPQLEVEQMSFLSLWKLHLELLVGKCWYNFHMLYHCKHFKARMWKLGMPRPSADPSYTSVKGPCTRVHVRKGLNVIHADSSLASRIAQPSRM